LEAQGNDQLAHALDAETDVAENVSQVDGKVGSLAQTDYWAGST
jgi:hypothetical protein